MDFNKCERCGSFFISHNNICGNCLSKDNMDVSKLKDYFNNIEEVPTFDSVLFETGISEKNLLRHLNSNNFIEDQNKIFDITK